MIVNTQRHLVFLCFQLQNDPQICADDAEAHLGCVRPKVQSEVIPSNRAPFAHFAQNFLSELFIQGISYFLISPDSEKWW